MGREKNEMTNRNRGNLAVSGIDEERLLLSALRLKAIIWLISVSSHFLILPVAVAVFGSLSWVVPQ